MPRLLTKGGTKNKELRHSQDVRASCIVEAAESAAARRRPDWIGTHRIGVCCIAVQCRFLTHSSHWWNAYLICLPRSGWDNVKWSQFVSLSWKTLMQLRV
jgi:hypothetical protein